MMAVPAKLGQLSWNQGLGGLQPGPNVNRRKQVVCAFLKDYANNLLSLKDTPVCVNRVTIIVTHDGFRPSAGWVDWWACWALQARQKISIFSEGKRSDLYVSF